MPSDTKMSHDDKDEDEDQDEHDLLGWILCKFGRLKRSGEAARSGGGGAKNQVDLHTNDN